MTELKYEVNATTGEILEREMTAEEIAQDELDRAEAAVRDEAAAASEAKAAAKKAAAEAKLLQLGLTAEDLAALGL